MNRLDELVNDYTLMGDGGEVIFSNFDLFLEFVGEIRQMEREACAAICDGISEYYATRTDLNQTQKQVGQLAAEVCGVRIRERGEK